MPCRVTLTLQRRNLRSEGWRSWSRVSGVCGGRLPGPGPLACRSRPCPVSSTFISVKKVLPEHSLQVLSEAPPDKG